jgi:3-phosphoshikimate 1-carboxyvinyltransferase
VQRLEIPTTAAIRGRIRPPGSKSITNRALVCAALASGQSTLAGALDSDDTQVMIAALRQLGIQIDTAAADPADGQTLAVTGCGGRLPAERADLFVGNSGTTIRFLAPMVALGHGEFRLDGTARMRERPIGDLLDAMRKLGAAARSELGNGCPPVLIEGRGLAGGAAAVRGNVSSQFLSGLLLAAPYAGLPVELEVEGTLVSQPYVHMTLAVMRAFGVDVAPGDLRRLAVPNHRGYSGCRYEVEPDASAASYFFAAAAITGGHVTVDGLSRHSLQGDVAFVDVLEQMGCQVRHGQNSITVSGRPLSGIAVDMNAISDTVQTLAAVALFAKGPTTITAVGHIRHKETDRIHALATELRKLGACITEFDDGLKIEPDELRAADIATYDDHRMAMSLALVGLRTPGVVILDPDCTRKTYPRFFDDLGRLAGIEIR